MKGIGIMHLCLSRSWGGLEMYPPHTCKALRTRDYEVHGIALHDSKVAEGFKSAGIQTIEFASPAMAILSIRSVLTYIRKHNIKIIHGHKSGDMRLGALLAAVAPEVRLFFTDHIGVTKPKTDWYHRWAYSKLSYLFSISKVTYERNLKALPVQSDRIRQLYSGIDVDAYKRQLTKDERANLRESLGAPDEAALIVLPGRIAPGKGHEIWIRALACLKKHDTLEPWHAVAIGTASGHDAEKGGYKDHLDLLVREADLGGKLTFAGFRDDMSQCLSACDIAVIPSENEAFGFSVIESMAAGCAVIGSDSGSLPELLGQTRGVLVSPKNVEAWATAMQSLISQTDLRTRMAQEARQWSLENFNIDHHVHLLTRYYQDSLSETN